MSRNWYLNDPFWQTFGPLMFGPEQFLEARENLPHLLKLADIATGDVLDLGCGPGRYALPLAELGFNVCAVDANPSFIEELNQRRSALPAASQAKLEVIHGDMRTFVRPEAFDLVVILWSTFGYFEDEADHGQVLDQAYQSLRTGGQLVIDVVGLETLARTLQPVHLTEFDDGRLLIERPTLIDDMTRLDNEWLLIEGDAVTRAHFSNRVWSAGEMAQLLASHGFKVTGVFGDYEGHGYDLEASRMVVVAKREDLV